LEGESFGNGGAGIFEGCTDIISGSRKSITGIIEGCSDIITGIFKVVTCIIEGLAGIITPVIIILERIIGILVLNDLFDFILIFGPFVGVSSSGNLGSLNCVVDIGPLVSG